MNSQQEIRLVIPGPPRGKPRAYPFPLMKRDGTPVIGKNGRPVIRMLKAKTERKDEMTINAILIQYMADNGIKRISGPVEVAVISYRKIPKSMSKKDREFADAGFIKPMTKPDIDNHEKLVFDAVREVACGDDSKIVRGFPDKRYDDGNGERTEIIIRPWTYHDRKERLLAMYWGIEPPKRREDIFDSTAEKQPSQQKTLELT